MEKKDMDSIGYCNNLVGNIYILHLRRVVWQWVF